MTSFDAMFYLIRFRTFISSFLFFFCFDRHLMDIVKLIQKNQKRKFKQFMINEINYHATGGAFGSTGTKTYKLTIPKTTMTKLIKYWLIPVPFFFLQKVERMKKRAIQTRSLFLMNIPALQSKSEMNEAPSGYSWRLSFLGSNNVTALGFLFERLLPDISSR